MANENDIEIAKKWVDAVKELPKEEIDAAITAMRESGSGEFADLLESTLAESSEEPAPKKKTKKSSEPVEV